MLLHGFQQRGLGLRRRAIDFIGQQNIGKDRTFDELHPSQAVAGFFQDLRAGDIRRHQVRRELNSLKLEMKDLGDRADQQRLGQSRAHR